MQQKDFIVKNTSSDFRLANFTAGRGVNCFNSLSDKEGILIKLKIQLIYSSSVYFHPSYINKNIFYRL